MFTSESPRNRARRVHSAESKPNASLIRSRPAVGVSASKESSMRQRAEVNPSVEPVGGGMVSNRSNSWARRSQAPVESATDDGSR
jgi:hypothetical protein